MRGVSNGLHTCDRLLLPWIPPSPMVEVTHYEAGPVYRPYQRMRCQPRVRANAEEINRVPTPRDWNAGGSLNDLVPSTRPYLGGSL